MHSGLFKFDPFRVGYVFKLTTLNQRSQRARDFDGTGGCGEQVNVRQKELFGITAAYQIYPEYYIIKVNKFDDVSKDSLDEWIYYFKNNRLPENYSAPGLDKVAELLNYNNMDANAKAQYEAHQKELAISYGVLETAKAEGRAEGEAKKTIAVVVNSFRLGLDIPTIAIVAGISEQEAISILKEQGMMS